MINYGVKKNTIQRNESITNKNLDVRLNTKNLKQNHRCAYFLQKKTGNLDIYFLHLSCRKSLLSTLDEGELAKPWLLLRNKKKRKQL